MQFSSDHIIEQEIKNDRQRETGKEQLFGRKTLVLPTANSSPESSLRSTSHGSSLRRLQRSTVTPSATQRLCMETSESRLLTLTKTRSPYRSLSVPLKLCSVLQLPTRS